MSTTHATENGFAKSQSRATSKRQRHLQNSAEDANHRYKIDTRFKMPEKEVPKLVAHDKKPAGERLYQGVVPPTRPRDVQAKKGRLSSPRSRKPPIGRSAKSNEPNSLFRMPPSLGGPQRSQWGQSDMQAATSKLGSAQRTGSRESFMAHSEAAWSKDRALYNQALSDYQKGIMSNQMPAELQPRTQINLQLAGNR